MDYDIRKPLTGGRILTVSPPPHWHCGRTIPRFMLETIVALLPAAILAVAFFGLDAVRVMALSCATAVAAEALCTRIMEREQSVQDFSALLTGLLFSFLLPASAPWWLVMVGSGAGVVLGRMVFGGLGGNPLCAPLVGWAVCRLSWSGYMDVDATMLYTSLSSPLAQLKYFGVEAASQFGYVDLLLGRQLAGLGTSHVLALLAGGVFLLLRRHIRPDIPLAFLAGVFLTATVFYLMDSGSFADPLFHLLTGSVVFGAFFLATDCSSSPVGHLPMILFGLVAGALTILIRAYGVYPDGVPFAILLANLLTPLLDRIRPKPFGGR